MSRNLLIQRVFYSIEGLSYYWIKTNENYEGWDQFGSTFFVIIADRIALV